MTTIVGSGILRPSARQSVELFRNRGGARSCRSRSLSGIAPSKQESTTYEPSLVCKLLILGCRLLIPDRLLGQEIGDLEAAVTILTGYVAYFGRCGPSMEARKP